MPRRRKTLSMKLPEEFLDKCEKYRTSPEEVLAAFIRDLCALDGSGGSDERDLAQTYFERCGYYYRGR